MNHHTDDTQIGENNFFHFIKSLLTLCLTESSFQKTGYSFYWKINLRVSVLNYLTRNQELKEVHLGMKHYSISTSSQSKFNNPNHANVDIYETHYFKMCKLTSFCFITEFWNKIKFICG